ncbi:Eco57I restriction-modification methylase domain-containing protein [Flavobacterium wongokense]|uniref:Eco57I restriction-modification methylase domain-containing protein n=1 Tax=Flavobacterium wongokense TaxID=2910674 RepID=UPI001F1968A6|nr:N-6 DNA methylase [Flavobacterium sp. WG47]MCF6131105.1 N-6 DNA methylase [Flavobacterium sp. WG47]
MPLFQNSVVAKQLQSQDKPKMVAQWNVFKNHFHNSTIQDNIRNSKEEQYQGEFLIDLFVNVLGYTKNPTPNFNITTEYKNVKDSKKADGAILINDKVKAVIELKGTKTTDLNKIEAQAFGYKNNQPECVYVITSNFEKLHFYIDNATEYLEFNLFKLTEKEFELLYLCLAYDNISNDIPKKIKEQSISQEKEITKKLYSDYSIFKRELHQNLVALNPGFDALELFRKSQKLLDRFLFIFFAEDRNLLPTNLIFRINKEWRQLQEMRMDVSLYDRYKIYFKDLNQGAKVVLPAFTETMSSQKEEHQIFAYNGGLFQPDNVLDSIKIDDELLYKYTQKLSHYDFQSEIDVNILGHIFENSLNELDEVKAQLEGETVNKQSTKRKKDGVFYTPKYITKYIVDNTIGKLCTDKKTELKIVEEDYFTDKKRTKTTKQPLLEKLTIYRNWLLHITICDPACGSGAFLNQALEFLIDEHRYIDELQAKLFGDALILSDVEKSILENNLYGVDLNEESVEIAKLSLWLRTAQPNRKLNDLNNNIKCGNSLIDDSSIAGESAFNWKNEFPKVFEKGGFDVVIGNPPYVLIQPNNTTNQELLYYKNKFAFADFKIDLFHLFFQLGVNILKDESYLSYITPSTLLYNFYAENLRGWINKKCEILKIAVAKEKVFEDADVHTAIYILKKTSDQKRSNYTEFTTELENVLNNGVKYNRISQSDLDLTPGKVWNLLIEEKNIKVLRKIGSKPNLGTLSKINRGLITGDRTKYFSTTKISDKYIPILTGSDVGRYSSNTPIEYVLFEKPKTAGGCWDAEVHLAKHKLCIRQIGFQPTASLILKPYAITGNLFSIIGNSLEFDKYLLALINSKAIKYYWQIMFNDFKTSFPQVTLFNLSNIPIPKANTKQQKPLSVLTDKMLSLNNDLQQLSQRFQRTLERKFDLTDLPKKLQDWYLLTYSDFIKELGKLKIKLTLSQEAEWEDYFNDEKSKLIALKTQIEDTDKEIDRLVYQLYGLTNAEIEIVENS